MVGARVVNYYILEHGQPMDKLQITTAIALVSATLIVAAITTGLVTWAMDSSGPNKGQWQGNRAEADISRLTRRMQGGHNPRPLPEGKTMFIPSKSWKEVLPNEVCPAGLEFKMDFSSGRNFARLPYKGERFLSDQMHQTSGSNNLRCTPSGDEEHVGLDWGDLQCMVGTDSSAGTALMMLPSEDASEASMAEAARIASIAIESTANSNGVKDSDNTPRARKYSDASTQAWGQLDKLDFTLNQLKSQADMLKNQNNPEQKSEMGHSRTVKDVVAMLDKLQREGVDAVATGHLQSGKDVCRHRRKHLNKSIDALRFSLSLAGAPTTKVTRTLDSMRC